MKPFTDQLMGYMSKAFAEDEVFPKNITVCESYKANITPTPKIVLYVSDDSEDARYTTFEGEAVSSVSIQITAFASQCKVGGEMLSAREAAVAFSEKLRTIFQKEIVRTAILEILTLRRVGKSSPLPLDSGEKTYFAPIRFEIKIKNL